MGVNPAVFKTAALPVRTSPPGTLTAILVGDYGMSEFFRVPTLTGL